MPNTRNLAGYENDRSENLGLFVYRGTDALEKGRGMCYNIDYATTDAGETAADQFGARGLKTIQKPNPDNNLAFAGVLTQCYPAISTGLQIVSLAMPGGCAMVKGIIATTINQTRLTCIAPSALQVASGYDGNAGLWGNAGLAGRGTAVALQTQADASDAPWEQDLVGNGVYTVSAGTVTASNAFTNAAVGDVVYILAGGVANAAKAGKYYIETFTSASAVILTDTPGGDAVKDIAADTAIVAFATTPAAGPLTLVYLNDGKESGLVEYDVPVNGATTNPMVGGWTNLIAKVTLAGAHVPPLADGLFPGMLKTVKLHGLLTTGFYQIDPDVLGLAPTGIDMILAELEDSLDQADLVWTGQSWDIKSVSVAAIATS